MMEFGMNVWGQHESRRDEPMDKTELVDSLDCQGDFCHVEASDVLGKDLVLDEHGHQVTTRQKLHQHVKERVVLEGCMQLDDPRAVGFR
jgi:hypothetical protein